MEDFCGRAMKPKMTNTSPLSILFGVTLLIVSLLNLLLVHPIPAGAYLLLALIYLPPADRFLKKWLGFTIPLFTKVILGIIIIWFTLGISDLGDMID